MRFARFFIDRPIFASVLSIIVFVVGLLSMFRLPISQYPDVVPPSVVVRAQYPGANPTVVAETVAAPLEQEINGVEHMLYMSSQASADGSMQLTVTFALGTDIDAAQVQVQNRVSQALPRLPEEVRRIGVATAKSSPDLLLVVHLVSPDRRYDIQYLRNYAALQVRDNLLRLEGVGEVRLLGSGDYAMRVWLDPQRLARRNLTAGDVVQAIREQNVQVAAGVLGAPPLTTKTDFELLVTASGRLTSAEEFGAIVLKRGDDGALVRLRDVARVELGAGQYSVRSAVDDIPAIGLPVAQAPGANALALSAAVRATMEEAKKNFPEGIDYRIVYDPTVFVRESIRAVITTLLEALALVVVVVILFLQTWRAALIPLLAVPVSIIGTFTLMHAFGFSINALSLFGLVLAIGIVVDDAIVVVENVQRNIEHGMAPREATYKAMDEVTGPIIAIALVLIAVFVPIAFISGLTGQFYQQFAITIAISTVISAFNSLTLSPALAAVLLRPAGAPPDRATRAIDAAFGWLFRPFNRFFERSATRYGHGVTRAVARRPLMLAMYAGLIALTVVGFRQVPGGFIPVQDKQYLIAITQLPDAASLDRTEAVMQRMAKIGGEHPAVANMTQFRGLSIRGFSVAANSGITFIGLKSFAERDDPALYGPAVAGALNQQFGGIQEAFISVFPPPAVQGLGSLGGFQLQLEDRQGLGYGELYRTLDAVLAKARQQPELVGVFSSYTVNVPQVRVEVDRERAKAQGVAITDIFQTMQVYLGSLYVNDFNRFGRTYQVIVQADADFRVRPEDILRLETRNDRGEMVPLGALVSVHPYNGADRVAHYNGYLTADISGAAAPGYSSGQAQAAMERVLAETLPNGIAWEWTDLVYQQILSGDTALYVFPFCVLFVFLVLAALYESWSLPLAIILIVPMCLLSAIAGVWLTGGDNNIFTQIALSVLVGLACKNAILIVEFAKHMQDQGMTPVQAAIEASRLRLRPILMTSLAFVMGVVPLVLASGAGAEMRQAIGIAVFSGMLGVTAFGLFLTPVFYVVVQHLALRLRGAPPQAG